MEKTVEEFIYYLSVERGLSKNTLASYRSDLKEYVSFCKKQRVASFRETGRDTVMSYLFYVQMNGRSPATISRRLAAVRSFYRFAVGEGFLEKDPSTDLESPRLMQKLPRVLSTGEVDLLLGQPSVTDPAGLRDKAMLELLYATGIRVSFSPHMIRVGVLMARKVSGVTLVFIGGRFPVRIARWPGARARSV